MKLSMTLSDLRGAAQLARDSTLGITGVVEQVHGTIMRLPLPLGPMRRTPDAGLARLVYSSIRGTTRLVDRAVGVALDPFTNVPETPLDSPSRDAFLAALNGAIGDHLARSGNPLALPMAWREVRQASPSAAGDAPTRRLVLLHGLCMNDRQWQRRGHDHGLALARDLGLTPVYLRYNSGLGVGENGRLFSRQMERLLTPETPAEAEINVLAYSLGGLVVRSALVAARQEGHQWPEQLRTTLFLGTPHTGAPLAAGGHALDRALGLSPYSAAFARLGGARSQGLHDLRSGLGADLEDWPKRARACVLAGAFAPSGGRLGDRLLGDGLVPVTSALAIRSGASHAPAIPVDRQWVARGVGHLDLLCDPGVYARLREWLT